MRKANLDKLVDAEKKGHHSGSGLEHGEKPAALRMEHSDEESALAWRM